ncbi:MAG: hypothetical protein MRY83_19945 [Flavobacteriales bacterium]|nr:hypothetical protein [Flavobacteriales bacterium]
MWLEPVGLAICDFLEDSVCERLGWNSVFEPKASFEWESNLSNYWIKKITEA